MSLTLAILAAGIGSRYGGLKQIDPVGPAGEIVVDYSIYDARLAGFDKVVFVIRRDIEADFRAWILARNIADGDALAHIERTLHLETFQLAPSAAGAGNPVPAPELP